MQHPQTPRKLAILTETLANLFALNPNSQLQAQFFSSQACVLVEKELAEAQIAYKTVIVKSKKRGLVYVILLLEPLEPANPMEPPRGAGD